MSLIVHVLLRYALTLRLLTIWLLVHRLLHRLLHGLPLRNYHRLLLLRIITTTLWNLLHRLLIVHRLPSNGLTVCLLHWWRCVSWSGIRCSCTVSPVLMPFWCISRVLMIGPTSLNVCLSYFLVQTASVIKFMFILVVLRFAIVTPHISLFFRFNYK